MLIDYIHITLGHSINVLQVLIIKFQLTLPSVIVSALVFLTYTNDHFQCHPVLRRITRVEIFHFRQDGPRQAFGDTV